MLLGNLRRGPKWVALGIFTSLMLLSGIAFAVVTDSGEFDVRVTDKTGYEVATLANAIVEYIGDESETFGASGSGTFDAFLRIQADGVSSGYNTDGNQNLEFDTKGGNFTHSIKVSDIPTVNVGGALYWELFADINDSDSTPLITLSQMEVYFSDVPDITDYPFDDTEQVYDFAGAIFINDVNQGSGRGDLRYLIDITDIAIPEDCEYGNDDCATYFVLFSEWGFYDGQEPGNFAGDGGFEEWKVKQYPVLEVSKTISGAFETPVTWTIDKTDDDAYSAFAGGSTPNHQYTIDVDPVLGSPANTSISGVITIVGDTKTTVNVNIEDQFDGTSAEITGCSVPMNGDGTYTVASKATVTCGYTLDLSEPVAGENIVSVSFVADGTELMYQGDNSIEVADYIETLTGEISVSVTDDNGTTPDTSDDRSFGPFTTSSHAAVNYSNSWTCSSDPEDYTGGHFQFSVTNIAEIDETGDTDTATVTVDCYTPVVSKDAAGSYDERHEWDVEKTVDPESQSAFAGETVNFDWEITVSEDVFEENFDVSGTVTVANPNPDAAMVVTLSDVLGDGTPVVFDTSSCALVGSTLTVAAGGSETCDYTADDLAYSDDTAAPTLNTATATLNSIDFDATATVSWAANVIDGTATLDDDQKPYAGESVDGGDVLAYGDSYTCSSNPADYTNGQNLNNQVSNTAIVYSGGVEQDQSTATTVIDCYAPVVSKDANTSWTRTWTWTIEKEADATELTLSEGQLFTVNYDVTVSATSSDNDWLVQGTITVENPHPTEAMTLTSLTDNAGGVDATVTCLTLVVPAGGELTCTYDTGAQDSVDSNPFGGTNTATASFAGASWTGTAPIAFDATPTPEIDECVEVSDTNVVGGLGGVCADDAPKTFEYSLDFGAHPDADVQLVCGENTHNNTASLVTNDTAATNNDTETVTADVACVLGCTLTQGYWKTHSFHGPAPYDDAWLNIGDFDGDGTEEGQDEDFFHSGMTWYRVFWTAPKGNAYFQAAHQWMAAYLNTLDGASTTPEVEAALSATGVWFADSAHTPDYASGLRGNDAERKALVGWASTLASYNEGLIGPGHCDEDSSSSQGFLIALIGLTASARRRQDWEF